MRQNDFVEYVTGDLLSKVRNVSARSMFGGWGLYKDSVIFGIVVDDVLYFRTGDKNRLKYEAAGSEPFSYETSAGKKVSMAYWRVPPEVLEDKAAAAQWAEESFQVNLERAAAASRPGKRKGRKK